jgi:hypothetical protein
MVSDTARLRAADGFLPVAVAASKLDFEAATATGIPTAVSLLLLPGDLLSTDVNSPRCTSMLSLSVNKGFPFHLSFAVAPLKGGFDKNLKL